MAPASLLTRGIDEGLAFLSLDHAPDQVGRLVAVKGRFQHVDAHLLQVTGAEGAAGLEGGGYPLGIPLEVFVRAG